MALTQKFYKEIYEKEKIWIGNLNQNLLNVFYLPELKDLYSSKYNELLSEYHLTGESNEMIKSYLTAINKMISKIDLLDAQDRKGISADLSDLNDLFIVNLLNNNIKLNQKKNEVKNVISSNMAFIQEFYDEIYDKEEFWIGNLNQNLLNVFYLQELKDFYSSKYNELLSEYHLTGESNEMIKSYLTAINKMISKIDLLDAQDRKGISADLSDLNDLFIVNLLNNNIKLNQKKNDVVDDKKSVISSNEKLNRINEELRKLYKLRGRVIKSDFEDYTDDFYYEEDEQKKVA